MAYLITYELGFQLLPTNLIIMESVVLETSLGDIQLELYWEHTPRTCKNFAELAKQGYYNGVVFHRIISVSRVGINHS
jgi:hypothetical protein